MWQPPEGTRCRQHRGHGQTGGVAQRKRGEDVGDVVATRHTQLVHRQQGIEAQAQHLLPVHYAQTKTVQLGLFHAPAGDCRFRAHQRQRQRVIAIDYGVCATAENTMLGLVVVLQTAVTIQVICRHIEHRGDGEPKAVRSLQLEAGQLQHVELALRCQQIQGRQAEITAYAHVKACLCSHGAEQCRHGGFGVGTGDAHHGRTGCAHEQVDIATYLRASRERAGYHRVIQSDAGADHPGATLLYHRVGDRSGKHGHLGHFALQHSQLGRIVTGINHHETPTVAV